MTYNFKDLMALGPEAIARDGYYRDWTHIDADTFHQISELAQFIREKGYGADTREAMAQALERVYHDAAQSGNANMEVSMARKSFKDLASRLDASDDKLTSTTAQLADTEQELSSQLAQKANRLEVFLKEQGININDFDEPTRQAFLEAQEVDVNYILGKHNVKNENIAFGAVAPNNTKFFDLSGNILQNVPLHKNKFISTDGTLTDNQDNDVFGLIDTDLTDSRGKVVHFSRPFSRVTQFSNSGSLWSGETGDGEMSTIQISQSAAKFYVSFDNRWTNTSDIVAGVGFVPSRKHDTFKNEHLDSNVILGEGNVKNKHIALEAVAPKNTQFFDLSGNILQDAPLHKNKVINPQGELADYPDNDVFGLVDTDLTDSRGKTVHFSRPFIRVAQFSDSGGVWSVANGDGKSTIEISQSVAKFYVSFDNRYTNTSDIVGGVGFVPSKKQDTIKNEYLDLSFIDGDKKDLTIELIGDSLTDQGLYIDTLKKKTGIENIVNHGISGSRVAQIREDASYDKDNISLVYRAKNNQIGNTGADITCIVAGINDWHGWRTLGDLETSTNDTEFYGAYKKVIEHILTINPSTTLILATPTYVYQTGLDPSMGDNGTSDGDIPRVSHGTGLIVKDFRDAVISLGEYYKLPVIDLYTLSGINKMSVNELTSDGLHWNSFGGIRIGNILGANINQQT